MAITTTQGETIMGNNNGKTNDPADLFKTDDEKAQAENAAADAQAAADKEAADAAEFAKLEAEEKAATEKAEADAQAAADKEAADAADKKAADDAAKKNARRVPVDVDTAAEVTYIHWKCSECGNTNTLDLPRCGKCRAERFTTEHIDD